MDRPAFIAALKTALDADDGVRVDTLCREYGDAHPDVATRARLAWTRAHPPESARCIPRTPAAAPAVPALRAGYYTVVLEDGHVTFRARRQDEDAKFAPGEMVVGYLAGPQNDEDYVSCAFAKDNGRIIAWRKFRDNARLMGALGVLARDPKAAGLGYAQASGRCYLCGRLLTTPESIEAGIGPVCASKGY